MSTGFLDFRDEVRQALRNGQPVVALESTIIAHGMPYPDNLQLARDMMDAVRSQGAVPAVMAILRGRMQAGLDEADLVALAMKGGQAGKVSRRDIARFLCDPQQAGATTVASTMLLASRAGIRFFATGGIGGVHRGAQSTWDVSADLPEFNQSGVAVISAGAKAVLDLPATLEYLETLGVPVVGYQTDEFPAFYSRSSGLKLDHSAPDVSWLARMLRLHWEVFPDRGVLVVQPVPASEEIPRAEIEPVITAALAAAEERGITGKRLTPYLLAEISSATAGRSLRANKALALHNADLAARLARAWCL